LKNNLHFLHGCSVKDRLDKRFKAVTDVKTNSLKPKHFAIWCNEEFLIAGGDTSLMIRCTYTTATPRTIFPA
jgi:hypothetical protein